MDYVTGLMWWGYLHSDGSIHVKRWFGDHEDYTSDVENNDFVVKVIPPFIAANRNTALDIILKRIAPE